MIYRIKDWGTIYENNRTRELKSLLWVPVPNKHDGDGYTALVDRENSAAYLGAWLAILQVASKCEPRGTLLREGAVAHNSTSIARMTRLKPEIIEETLLLCLRETKWLELVDLQGNVIIPHEGAGFPHPPAEKCLRREGKGREVNGMEGKELLSGAEAPTGEALEKGEKDLFTTSSEPPKEPETPPDPSGKKTSIWIAANGTKEAKRILAFLNERAGRSFRETEANLKLIFCRLKEIDFDTDGTEKMIARMVQKWGADPKMMEFLRPETLFRASKFGGYYDCRDLPIETNSKQTSDTRQGREEGLKAKKIIV